VQLANATPSLTKAKNDMLLAKSALKMALGISPDRDLSIRGGLEYTPYDITLEEAHITAAEKRSELHRLAYEIKTFKSYVDVAKKEMLPQLSLHGSYSYANDGLSTDGEAEWDYSWNLGLSLDYKLFDGWEKSSRVEQNRKDLSAATIKREETASMVKLEVETAFAWLGEARELIRSQEKNIENAERAFAIAETGQLNGVISQLELMDAQLALTEARSNYKQAVYDWLIARVQLEKAMGIVMDESSPPLVGGE
ncbi:MAG: TolC family protein, partial [bacterium]|nr:TolC family protein [bacterium]